jgi:hypothetical protein
MNPWDQGFWTGFPLGAGCVLLGWMLGEYVFGPLVRGWRR